jgi:hypothetical protein
MTSWVVLSMTWLELSAETLRARLDRAFPSEFLPPRASGTFVVEGPVAGAQFLINSAITGAAGTFMLNSIPGPYTEFSDFAAQIADRELRRLAIVQQAWLSVDLIAGAMPHDAYRFIGTALAELAPADAAVLVDAGSNTSWRFTDDIRRQLRNNAEII